MWHLSIDIETYSSVDLKRSGLYRYAQSPDFQILLLAYSWGGQEVKLIDLTCEPDSAELDTIRQALQDSQVIKHAYNAAFEVYCLNRAGFYTQIDQWRCTMLHGMYCGYTAGLGPTGVALGLPQDKRKLATGGSLIRTFCNPCKPTRTNGYRSRTLPHHEPEKWQLFKEYCIQDVVTEMEIATRLARFPVPDDVQRQWVLDQSINIAGVAIEPELVEGALYCGDVAKEELTAEAQELSGLDNPNSNTQLQAWLREALAADDQEGESNDPEDPVPDVTKATVSKLLGEVNDDTVRRMLEIRQELAKTSVTKYAAMRDAVCDDNRVRGLIQNYGANRTGRAAGRLVQVQNLPRNYLGTLDIARRYTCEHKLDHLRLLYGNVPDTLSQLIRTAFIPSPGNRLVVVDFSAIEARVIAWLAGEAWRQQVFATHGKIYEASASAMFDIPIERIVKGNPEYEYRQRGKVAELALGYQGSVGALKQMGALHMGLTEEELPEIVQRWRNANKRIVDLWYAMDNAAVDTVETGRGNGVNGVLFNRVCDDFNDFLTIMLPSGRQLFYASPGLTLNRFGQKSISYRGVDQKKGKWAKLETYGGKLTENVVQAIARDCLYWTMEQMAAQGWLIIFHVHDEVVLDVPAAQAEEVLVGALEIMKRPIPWAKGLQLKGDGDILNYYQKS